MKQVHIRCPYCKANATLRPASFVYGEAANPEHYLYVCDHYPECDSYVSAHKKSKRPMGRLANARLRQKRIQAHKAFQEVIKQSGMSKDEAYQWMKIRLGLKKKQAHIAKFGEHMCERLINICKDTCVHLKQAA